MNFKNISDKELLVLTENAVATERHATAAVIKHLHEINDRRLYLECGFDSLFIMLRKKFNYREPSAQLRINAVRLLSDVPEVEAKLESGEMSLTVAANIQTFLYQEKRRANEYSQTAKIELIEFCATKSVLEVQREFAKRNPELEKRESVRFTSEDRLRVSHSISLDLEEKLNRIKLLWSHVDPDMSRELLLDRMAEITLDQIDPVRKAARAEKRKLCSFELRVARSE